MPGKYIERVAEASRTLWTSFAAYQTSGRIDTLRTMIAAFPDAELRRRAPLALTVAWAQIQRLFSHILLSLNNWR